MIFTTSKHSAEIKTEVLQIVDAFELGSFKRLVSFEPDYKLLDYIKTVFETTTGEYVHFYRVK